MNSLCIGTAQFGMSYGVANAHGKPTSDRIKSILKFAISNGIRSLDTAISYGDSEIRLGQTGVSDWAVVSKLPKVPAGVNNVNAWVQDQVMGSLNRLGVDSLDGLLLHHPKQLLCGLGADLYSSMREQVALGHARRIGISIYDSTELDILISRFNFDIVQAPLNILDGRLIQSGWIARLQDSGVALHVRSAFLQGLLLMPASQRPPYFERWAPLWSKWSSWLAYHDLTPLQACLRYVLHAPGIEQVVLGVDSEDQLSEIITVANEGPIPDGYQSLQVCDPELLNPSLWKIK